MAPSPRHALPVRLRLVQWQGDRGLGGLITYFFMVLLGGLGKLKWVPSGNLT